jgi:Holliday junction resolvase RusA-like endonuclease
MRDDAPSHAELDRPVFRFEFTVPGHPQPAGSKRGFPVKRKDGARGVAVVDDNPRTKAWQATVALTAADALQLHTGADDDPELLVGPLGMALTFTFKRPQGHFGSGRNFHNVRASAPAWPAVRPDTTKLVRAVEDALTGVVWRDDAQVVEQYAAKRYGEPEGVRVTLWTL